jgi:hypothetical protein
LPRPLTQLDRGRSHEDVQTGSTKFSTLRIAAGNFHFRFRYRPTSDEGRDDFILQERLTGRSARSIAKQLSLTVGEVNASLDRTLPTIDNAMRLRHISLDLHRLDGLLETFYKRAIEKTDTQAALAVVKILERKAALLAGCGKIHFDRERSRIPR